MSPFRILVYHRIGPEDSSDGTTIGLRTFQDQMDTLRRRHHPMRLGKVVESLSAGKSLPPRTVAVTFDDGYRDTFDMAFPVLQRLKIPATLFVTTGYLDGHVLSRRGPMLSWRMVREMHRKGMEVGSHTVTHPNLLACNQSQLHREICVSRQRLEEELKAPITLFAYPYGRARFFNRTIQDYVRKAGYQAACATLIAEDAPDTDLYALPRISLSKNEIRCFAFELSELSKNQLSSGESGGIQGVNARTVRLWRTRYGKMGKGLRREDLFRWSA